MGKIKYCVLGCWIGSKKKYGICGYDNETLKYVGIADVKYEFDNASDAIKEAIKMNRKRKHEITNTEVEEFIDKILFSVRYAKEGHDDYESALNDIEERCRLFIDEYICPYEKYTEEWYDEHGE